MPAEWERQQSTLIGWPYNKNDWPGKFKNIPKIFAEIISKITKSQEAVSYTHLRAHETQ